MNIVIILAALLGAVALGLVGARVYLWWQGRVGRYGLTKKTFLTGNEVDFYRRLVAAVDGRWVVFPQVSMGALMNTTLKPMHPDYWNSRNTFAAKICDFVLCDPRTLAPQIVVELDDVMHDFERDRRRDTLAARAGYRTVRFWSRNKPTVAQLAHEIDRVLALN